VWKFLTLVAEILVSIQSPQGHWDEIWLERLPGKKKRLTRFEPNDDSRILVTGHHLEWLLLLPSEIAPPPETFRRAGQWLLPVLLRETKDRRWVVRWYCPAVHAARSVAVLADLAPAAVVEGRVR